MYVAFIDYERREKYHNSKGRGYPISPLVRSGRIYTEIA
jgi:hypothetical protein